MPPYGVQGKALVGTPWKSSQTLRAFSTLKSLTFDYNISPS